MKINMKERKFDSATGNTKIRYCMWIPEEIHAAVQLTHGMAEYIDRYDSFARFLAENGVLVFGQDHAGHGKSVGENKKGFFAKKNGWDALVQDMRTLLDIVKKDYPGIPYILFGHSMGSFLARTYASRDGKDFDAFVFCGTAGGNPALPIAKLLVKGEIKKLGAEVPSPFINNLAFGSYNKPFAPNRTEYDWLSRNTENVDKYVADDLCGFPFTTSAMCDMFDGLSEVNGKKWAKKVPKKPVFLIAGEKDPVGNMGKGVKQVNKWLADTGHKTEMKLYKDCRHEILNEDIREDVYKDVLLFVEAVAASGEFEK